MAKINNFNNVHFINGGSKLIYKIDTIEESSNNCLVVYASLVAGYVYNNTDCTNRQGWGNPENFIEEVQNEYFTFYPLDETLTEVLEGLDFRIMTDKEIDDKIGHLKEAITL
jgi:hypothetical protein